MNNRKQQIDEFFNRYSELFNKALNGEVTDFEETAALYSNCFIGANPSGVYCGKNDEQFRDAMHNGYAFYKNIGITLMEIMSKEISFLDGYHTMIKVLWKSSYVKKDGSKGSIEFENIYFTQTRENQHKVFAYITGDEQAALKQHGLL